METWGRQVLHGLPYLAKLNLTHNKITAVPKSALANASRLNHNAITVRTYCCCRRRRRRCYYFYTML